ncbi:MAG: dephospho-CoA kinase [Propionibacteriaceae bacterium]
MLRVGLTGGIASGKTIVSDELMRYGAIIIDADVLAREVVAPGTNGLRQIAEHFGSKVLTADGSLDRSALASIVFADDKARAELNAIVHPLVRKRAQELEVLASADAIVVHVIPLLVETRQADQFDVVVVVDISEEAQICRLMERNNLTREQAQARIAAQASREERIAVADIVVSNQGSRRELLVQCNKLWKELQLCKGDGKYHNIRLG